MVQAGVEVPVAQLQLAPLERQVDQRAEVRAEKLSAAALHLHQLLAGLATCSNREHDPDEHLWRPRFQLQLLALAPLGGPDYHWRTREEAALR